VFFFEVNILKNISLPYVNSQRCKIKFDTCLQHWKGYFAVKGCSFSKSRKINQFEKKDDELCNKLRDNFSKLLNSIVNVLKTNA